MTSPASDPELPCVHAFLSGFRRRQAARTVDFPGGFAVFDDAYALSRGNNHLLVDGPVDPQALPGLADEVQGSLPYRHVQVLGEEIAAACREPMQRAGYGHSTSLVMCHRGPVPAHGGAREVDPDVLREPATASWSRFAPQASPEYVRDMVERRAARRRGAELVRFLAAHSADGEVAAWVDLYMDPVAGIAQIEDLVTAEAHLGQGHAGAVLDTALHMAADAGCTTRFLTARPDDWPHRWYRRKGFEVVGSVSRFERA
ncbi:GNAT family N-acetyltransferase [Streptomyces sp. NBC_00094]|uniref:GNAT family N-acetyltransferase n=1 Tax=Streptomyces sp. NBC_00094 TaxID=2903620 RepID=UPI002259C205|nr:GNAT family N-acetyltransferase [Streptomyces sp. NBC_00094]MCX5392763.1 GNAT family N-acetyltransferase [Streptomyces sp. NBC_00094]